MLTDGLGKNNETVYGKVAAGDLPLLVYVSNKHEMEQMIWIKKDFPSTKVVLVGGSEAPFVAKELAAAGIPIILTEDRGGPTTFRTKDALVGPPLTRSIASYLKEAGVQVGFALLEPQMPTDFKIHDLLPEAGWTAKYAGLSDAEAVQLVTSNIEDILGLKSKNQDIVVFEGNPLHYGATAALTFAANSETGALEVAGCFPRENDAGGWDILLPGLVLIDAAFAQLPGIPTVPFKANGKNTFSIASVSSIIVDSQFTKSTDKSGLTLIPPTLHDFGATFANDLQQVFNKTITATDGSQRQPNTIFLTIDSSHEFLDAAGRPTTEGYTLVAEQDGITIRGASPLGAWWGTRTLLQQAILGRQRRCSSGSGR
ncbi:hypothetical protein NQ176_g11014 [Zarea fungicola]|uniref:Uncharacterized protein n=1 Tax=Zarea fungicola TaxID=93591 RepID=A0ACC1MD59_9HYPO|nr:hypothetical protein NQ176_g11014 [Lecanicillium fungicola]